jgi:GH24 family phage-related lysozyme (muramidase)
MSGTARQLLEEEEGISSHAYQCDGLWHVGMGCLIDSSVPSDGLCKEAIDAQATHDIAKAQALATAIAGFDACNDVRQAVLISMCFQLGNLAGWPKFRAALAAGDYATAAEEGRNSAWAKTQTPLRAKRELDMLASGQWIDKGSLEA